jgi:hypothetical protein
LACLLEPGLKLRSPENWIVVLLAFRRLHLDGRVGRASLTAWAILKSVTFPTAA